MMNDRFRLELQRRSRSGDQWF